MGNNDLEVTDFNLEDDEIQQETPKKKKNNVMSIVLITIGLICMGISLYGLFDIYMEYKKAADIYQEAEDKFVQIHDPANEAITEVGPTTETETETEEATEMELPPIPWYQLVSVDTSGLKAEYPDFAGWIYFEDGLISYPVMHAEDNEKYLHTTYNGKDAKAGSIFVEATHSGDFTDTHTIVYGHNMKDLSMFGRLKHYKTQGGYYEEHKYFQIFCGDEILRYQIFAYRDVPVDFIIYSQTYTSGRVLSYDLLRASYINPQLKIKDDDKIITLSTCTADDTHRFIVSAVLTERYNVKDGTLVVELEPKVEE